MFAGIEGKSSPLKNIGLLLPSWIFRPSYGPGVSLLLRSSSLSQIATEEWRGEYISPRVQWHDEEWGILLPTNRIFSVVKLLKDEGKSAMKYYFKMLIILELKSRKQNIWLPTFLILMYYKDWYDVMVHTNCGDNINFTTTIFKKKIKACVAPWPQVCSELTY